MELDFPFLHPLLVKLTRNMKCRIHNKHLIKDSRLLSQFELKMERNLELLEKLINGNKSSLPDIYLTNAKNYLDATLYLWTQNQLITIDSKARGLGELAAQLLEDPSSKLLRSLLDNRRESKNRFIHDPVSRLDTLEKNKDMEQFDFLIRRLMPGIRGFIRRYLKNKNYKVDPAFSSNDVTNEIHLVIYDRFAQRPKNKSEFPA